MKILILGGTGMLGHRLLLDLSVNHEVWATIRGDFAALPDFLPKKRVFPAIDAKILSRIARPIKMIRPDVVINCIGLIKQRDIDPLDAIDLNSRLPHQLAQICARANARLIHISTDCVFSGKTGMYSEDDTPDAYDIYGKTKNLGEVVNQPHVLTIRTSLIGRELANRVSLLEWFLAQRGSCGGYSKAVFSGFPTYAVAQWLNDYVLPRPDLHGLYHVSAAPIDKFTLLQLFKAAYHHDIEIAPNDKVVIDRSLDSTRFRQATGFVPQDWETMIQTMANDPTPYADWRA
jgi:dTDP-4-dehydrorhamnose reductase